MVATTDAFTTWLEEAGIRPERLTQAQQAVLHATFRFRERQGQDYYSTRLLSHFLLHCATGLKVAQIARLTGISRPTASGQQGLSSKAAIQQAHHRLEGRPHGKLLPRFAGPIAQFLLTHPKTTRYDLLDFIEATFAVRVSRIALYKFLKKYGLDQVSDSAATAVPTSPPPDRPHAVGLPPPATPRPAPAPAPVAPPDPVILRPSLVVPAPAPPFSSGGRNTPAPSC
jgi:hypothetical protein